MEVTVVLDPADRLLEVAEPNHTATAAIGGTLPESPPPMLTALTSTDVLAGSQVTLDGRDFRTGPTALNAPWPTAHFAAAFQGDNRALLTVARTAPDGVALLSVADPDGRQSNVLPLGVRAWSGTMSCGSSSSESMRLI